MNAAQALTRLRKVLGKKANIHDYRTPSSPEQRAINGAKRDEAKARKDEIRHALDARRAAVLAADPEYRNLFDAFAEANEALESLPSRNHYRYHAGVDGGIFFRVDGKADTLAELVELIERKKAAA